MKMPEYQPIACLDELVEVFGDTKGKLADFLKKQKVVVDTLNAKLEKYEKVKNIETLEAQAQAHLKEAHEINGNAKAHLDEAKKEARIIIGNASEDAAGVLKGVEEERKQLRRDQASMVEREAEANRKIHEAEDAKKHYEHSAELAKSATEESNRVKAEYEARMDAIRAAAG